MKHFIFAILTILLLIPTWADASSFQVGKPFFQENFSGIAIGEVPANWLGTEHAAVQKDAKGHKYLASFEPGPLVFKIPNVKFPKDWKLTWAVIADAPHRYCYVQIGNLVAGHSSVYDMSFPTDGLVLGNSKVKSNEIKGYQDFTVEKRGDVLKLFSNQKEVLMARYPTLQVGRYINLYLSPDDQNKQVSIKLYSITGYALSNE